MPSDLKATLTLEIKPDGPRFNLTDLSKVEAYDRCDVELAADTANRRIDIQPSVHTGQLRLMLVIRSAIDPKQPEKPDPQKLRYQVNGSGPWISLENWHLLASPGIFNFWDEPPTWLNFENKQAEPVTITILVARDTLPAAPPNGEQPDVEEAETAEETRAETAAGEETQRIGGMELFSADEESPEGELNRYYEPLEEPEREQ